MELILIPLWMVVALLSHQLWVLRKAHGSSRQILKKLPDRIRSGLGVVGARELKNIKDKIFRLEQQVHIRKVLGIKAGEYFQQFQECSQKVELSGNDLEPFDDSVLAMDGSVPRLRSIMWKCLRFTLSDSIWFQTGIVPNEDVEDDQVQSMVQGPICRGCLKRLVGRVPVHISGVPARSATIVDYPGAYMSSIIQKCPLAISSAWCTPCLIEK